MKLDFNDRSMLIAMGLTMAVAAGSLKEQADRLTALVGHSQLGTHAARRHPDTFLRTAVPRHPVFKASPPSP